MHKYASPKFFYSLAGRMTPWLGAVTALLLLSGLYLGLFVAPADYQQGESYRIMFIHVPAAWMSMFRLHADGRLGRGRARLEHQAR